MLAPAAQAAERLAPHPWKQMAKAVHGLEPPPVYMHPVDGAVDYGTAANRFGDDRGSHMHAGQDVFAPAGTRLRAVGEAVVAETGTDGGRGNYLYLRDVRADRTYAYFHMLEPTRLREGDRVRAGQTVGALGCTGSCWGDHLHFEVHRGGDPYGPELDPLPLLQRLDNGR